MTMLNSGFVLGISGSTCAGKTTLSKALVKVLRNTIESCYINQDEYYYEEDSGKHVFIPSLEVYNWELLSAFDNDKMVASVKSSLRGCSGDRSKSEWVTLFSKLWKAVSFVESDVPFDVWLVKVEQKMKEIARERQNLKIVILDGILLFNHKSLHDVCDARIFLKLDDEVCKDRRSLRVYEPPDVPGYYEQIVRPYYEENLKQLEQDYDDIIYIDSGPLIENFKIIIQEVLRLMNND